MRQVPVMQYQAYRLTEDGLMKPAAKFYGDSAWPRDTEAEAMDDCDTYGGNVVLRVFGWRWVDDTEAK